MKIKKFTLGFIFWMVALLISGVALLFVSLQQMLEFHHAMTTIYQVPVEIADMSAVKVPADLMAFAFIVQILLAIVLLSCLRLTFIRKIISLHFIRFLVLLALFLCICNPLFSMFTKAAITLALIIFTFYLYQPAIEEIFTLGFLKESYYIQTKSISEIEEGKSRSWTVMLSGLFEFVGAAFLLFSAILYMPPAGWRFSVMENIPTEVISLTMSKPFIIALSVFLMMAAAKMLNFQLIGRRLNILLGFIGLAVSIVGVFFLRPINVIYTLRSYTLYFACLMFWSFITLFLMINPIIKKQFMARTDEGTQALSFFQHLVKRSGVLVVPFVIFIVAHVGVRQQMSLFMSSPFFSEVKFDLLELAQDIKSVPAAIQADEIQAFVDAQKMAEVYYKVDVDTETKGIDAFEKEKILRSWNFLINELKIFMEEKKFPEAEAAARKIIQYAEANFGQQSEQCAAAYNNLGLLLFSQKRYDESIEALANGLRIHQIIYGKKDTQVATDLINMAKVYRFIEKYIDAGLLYKRALKILVETYGEEHYTVLSIEDKLNEMEKEQRRKK